MIWMPVMMPTHKIAGKAMSRNGNRASHHHFLGLAFWVWIGAILCQYVCADIGKVETVVTVSRRLRLVMRGLGFSPVKSPSFTEPSLLRSCNASGSGSGRLKILSSCVNICRSKIMPKKMTRYQKQNRQPCDSVMYPAATGPIYDPVPRAKAKRLNLVPR